MAIITPSLSGSFGTIAITGSLLLSGSTSGSEGSTSGSAGTTTYEGSGSYTTVSYSGSYVSSSADSGSTSASPGATTYEGAATHSYTTVSTSGSYTSGSGGTTEISGGSITISGSSPGLTLHTADLYVGGFVRVTGAISGASTLAAVGATILGSTLSVSGTVTVAQKIEHAGDTDTYIEFTPDSMAVVVGAEEMIFAVEGAGGSQADKVTINNGSEDVDFQVKGSSVPNLIRTDAANNKVGIGMAADTFASHTLTVVGTISGSGVSTFASSVSSSGDVAVTGAMHAAQFYGGGAGLTGVTAGAPTSLSGTTAQLTTGVETSGYLKVSGSSTFDGVATHTAHPIFNTGITIKNADASAGYINFYEQSSNGTNVCTFRGKSSIGNITITLPGDTGTVVLEDNTVTLSNKTLTAPKVSALSGSSTLHNVGASTFGSTIASSGSITGGGGVISYGGVTVTNGVYSGSAGFHTVDLATFGNDILASGSIVGNGVTSFGGFTAAGGHYSGSGDFHTVGHVTLGGNVTATGSVNANGVTSTGGVTTNGVTSTAAVSSSSTLHNVGVGTFGNALLATGSIATDADLTVGGGDITYGNGQNATLSIGDASGTNIAGRDLTISAGNGTGTGFPGNMSIKVPKIGTSGGTVHTAVEILQIRSEGVTTHWNQATAMLDDQGMGDLVYFGTGTTTAGKMYYLNSGSAWAESSAALAASGAVGLLGVAVGSNPASNGMLVRGFYDVASYFSGAFTVGQPVYIQAGATISTMRPSGSGEMVRIVGHCTTTANVIYFNPSSEYIELA